MVKKIVFYAVDQLGIHLQKIDFDPYLSPCTKINSKWIIKLNVNPKAIKFLEEIIGENLCYLGLGKDFWDKLPKELFTKEHIGKLDLIKILKDAVKRMERWATDYE